MGSFVALKLILITMTVYYNYLLKKITNVTHTLLLLLLTLRSYFNAVKVLFIQSQQAQELAQKQVQHL